MTIDLDVLARDIKPEETILLLGAGVSIPSGAPSGIELRDFLAKEFSIDNFDQFGLAEIATVIETRFDRSSLIKKIRQRLSGLQPTGGLLSIPNFNWATIFTTNYDTLVESSFRRAMKPIRVLSSNEDFHGAGLSNEAELFKIHGTIDKDLSDGNRSNSRIIISSTDYDKVTDYRQALYSRLRDMLFSKSVLIIGQSLVDDDLKNLVNEAQKIKSEAGAPGKIYVLVFERNDDFATIFEARGLTVCFGGIDELFTALLRSTPSERLVASSTTDLLGVAPILEPATTNVSVERSNQVGQLEKMFNGHPAIYADILRGWTFEREISQQIESQFASTSAKPISLILGVAGVGKTTAARIALSRLVERGIECWEHKQDFSLEVNGWLTLNDELAKRDQTGILFIDEAHNFLHDINTLVETLAARNKWNLRILLISSRPHWNHRTKSPELFKNRVERDLSQLSTAEINRLLDLLDSNPDIRTLVEENFLGFNRPQRLDRLIGRCDADMFVCLKNIFGFNAIDTILLAEYAALPSELQKIYRLVSGMQAIGAKVHREMVRRLTQLPAANVASVVEDMEGRIEEYTVSSKDGIYGWQVRHPVIASIIKKYKFDDQDKLYELFYQVVEKLNPAYKFEAQSLTDMCDIDSGITNITDRSKQNVILRKMISKAPGLRVPRHRLIYNLIEMANFEIAENEIRTFERRIGVDGPIQRYKIRLKLGLARHADGIQDEDRAAIVSEAAALSQMCLDKYPEDKKMYRVALETAVDWYKYTRKSELFEEVFEKTDLAHQRLLDPELRRLISQYQTQAEKMGLNLYD